MYYVYKITFYKIINSLRNNLASVFPEGGPELTVDLLEDDHRRNRGECEKQDRGEKEPSKSVDSDQVPHSGPLGKKVPEPKVKIKRY